MNTIFCEYGDSGRSGGSGYKSLRNISGRVVPVGVTCQRLGYRSNGSADMLVRSLPIADANAHRTAATPGCAAEESLAIGCDRLDHGIGPAVVIVFPRSGAPIRMSFTVPFWVYVISHYRKRRDSKVTKRKPTASIATAKNRSWFLF